jgi:hypothetical protein
MFSHIFKGGFLTPFGSHPPNFSVEMLQMAVLVECGEDLEKCLRRGLDKSAFSTFWRFEESVSGVLLPIPNIS